MSITPEHLPERFSSKLRVADGGCWIWQAGIVPSTGYSAFWDPDKQQMVSGHRWGWEYLNGLVPAGLHLDHLCRVRACVNPMHLEPVTPSENTKRGTSGQVRLEKALARTVCSNGHALSGTDGAQRLDRPGLRCRACARETARRYRERQAAA